MIANPTNCFLLVTAPRIFIDRNQSISILCFCKKCLESHWGSGKFQCSHFHCVVLSACARACLPWRVWWGGVYLSIDTVYTLIAYHSAQISSDISHYRYYRPPLHRSTLFSQSPIIPIICPVKGLAGHSIDGCIIHCVCVCVVRLDHPHCKWLKKASIVSFPNYLFWQVWKMHSDNETKSTALAYII